MRLGFGLILQRVQLVGNIIKKDTGPECILGIKGVVYETGGYTFLLRMGPVRNPLKEDMGP